MGKLIYETKGADKRRVITVIICALIIIGVGIALMNFSNAKTKTMGISTGYMNDEGKFVQTSSGQLGGKDVFTSEGKRQLIIVGVVLLVVGVAIADCGIGMNRCWLKVYDDHAEGQKFALGIRKDVFHCTHQQIQSIQMKSGAIQLNVGGKSMVVFCKNSQDAFNALNLCRTQGQSTAG